MFSALRADPIAKWRALLPNELLQPLDSDAQIDLVFFLAQTYVAQTVVALTERFFDLERALAERLLVPSVFAWSNDARDRIDVDDDILVELQKRAQTRDPFGELYALFFAPELRRALGEFYTPPPLARFLYSRATALWQERTNCEEPPSALDPTCGAGVFLTAALRALRTSGVQPEKTFNYVEGFELSPLSALVARANLLFAAFADLNLPERRRAIDRLLREREAFDANAPILPITLADALRDRPVDPTQTPRCERRFDLLIGNPPWIAWDKLAKEYRDATKRYWQDYGLFTLGMKDARMGGGKKGLAGLMVYATIDRRLQEGGVFSFVLPRSLFQSGQSGEGFRRFGRGAPVAVSNDRQDANDRRAPAPFRALELDDFADLRLFAYVTIKASALTGVKDANAQGEIVARRWRRANVAPTGVDEYAALGRELDAVCEFGRARPASDAPGAPLQIRFPQVDAPNVAQGNALRARVDELAARIMTESPNATSDYVAKLGANAAGASGVFWLELLEPLNNATVLVRNLANSGRRAVEQVETRLESELIFPLVRWKDVDEFRVQTPQTYILVPQIPERRRGYDEETMRAQYPLTLEYLKRFEEPLRARAAYKKFQYRAPYWSLYNVDETTFASYKVVWRRMDSKLRAAVLKSDERNVRPLVPQDLLATVCVKSLQEADYLAALLNSTPMRERAEAASVPSSKSFGSPGILALLKPKRFEPDNPDAVELAALGKELRLETKAQLKLPPGASS